MLRSVPPDRAPAVVGCAENQKLPKVNARMIRVQAGVGGIAMQRPNRHRILAILLGFKWKTPVLLTNPRFKNYEFHPGETSTGSRPPWSLFLF